MIGKTLSHFRVVEKIGEGGMGVIYRAVDERLHRDVALKVLPPHRVEDPERRAWFLREARAAAAVAHPNLATVYEVDEKDGQIFIAMELVDGENLGEILARPDPPSLPDLLDVALQVADGLAEAHSRRIVHLDLKPENVMVGRHGRVKVLDFGLARLLGAAPRPGGTPDDVPTLSLDRADAKRVAGTAYYMSPEQALGRPLDERSDVFSFGAMVYEMVAGVKPFRGENLTATLAKILEAEPKRPGALRPDLPAALEVILLRCLNKDPAARYPDAVALLADLRRLRTGVRDRAEPGPGREGAGGEHPAPSPATIAVFPFSVRGGGEYGFLREGLVDLLTTKLDGAGEIRCVDAHVILCCSGREGQGPQDPAGHAEEARRFGAGLFVLGNVLAMGGVLHLDASLYETGDPARAVAKATAQGEADRIFEMVDDLTVNLLADRCGGPDSRFTRIAAMTSRSFPALKAYLEGEREMRAMRRGPAIEAFGRAVQEDPGFALAWYRRSVAGLWAGRPGIALESMRRAVDHAARLSERDRQLVEAFQAVLRGANDEAERLYRDFLGSYPDDLEAWYQLAEVLFHYGPQRGRSLADSRPAWERVLDLDPNHLNGLLHLAWIAASVGDRRGVERALRHGDHLILGTDASIWWLALGAFALGDASDREELLVRLGGVTDYSVNLTVIFVSAYAGDIRGAADLAAALTDPVRSPAVRARGHVIRAHLELALGRRSAARRDLDAAGALHRGIAAQHGALLTALPFLEVPREEIARVREELGSLDHAAPPGTETAPLWANPHQGLEEQLRAYLQGLLSVRLGEPDRAEALAAEIERLGDLPDSGHLVRDLGANLRGHAAAARGEPGRALAHLERARMEARFDQSFLSPFHSQAYERFARAALLTGLGRPRESLPWYGSFAQNSVYDLVYLAPSHFHRGEIHERLGEAEAAVRHYTRFADLWSECDPGLRGRVEAARDRAARLRGR
ncbi:MAG: protein kinase [Acidobacteria bacterium]|nr:protein kinase [Acidobacteriota bacterium]